VAQLEAATGSPAETAALEQHLSLQTRSGMNNV